MLMKSTLADEKRSAVAAVALSPDFALLISAIIRTVPRDFAGVVRAKGIWKNAVVKLLPLSVARLIKNFAVALPR